MPRTLTACPSAADLEQLLAGRLTEQDAETAFQHLESCGRCQAAARGLAPADALLSALRQGPPGLDPAEAQRAADLIARLREQRPADADAATVGVTLPGGPGGAAETQAAMADPVDVKAARERYAFLAPPEAPDEIGRLGGYRVLRVLGAGGMGVVFRAEDPKLQRGVAMKAMLPAVAADASAKQRFLREARAVARMKHDHVVTIYEVNDDHGVPFLVMELLEGENLEERLRRVGRLPAAEVLRIGREVAAGLEAAHSHELIHRDVKPLNLWLEAGRDRVKVLDFGLARPEGGDDSGLTREGAVMGTPGFMAPEQANGEKLDKRCDLFSLGCVLYRMATGHNPFASLRDTITHEPPPAAAVAADLPPGLSELIARLLAKRPADRPASAAAVIAELERIGRGEAPPAPPAAAPRRRRRRIAAVAVGLLLLGLAVAAVAVVLHVATPDGEVVVRTDDSDIELTATKGGGLVRIHDLKGGHTWQLDANKYTLSMADADDGLTIDIPEGKPFVLRRKGDGVVTITRQAAANPVVVAPSKGRVPLDALRREDIPRAALGWPGGGDPDRAPPELVAILGDGRFRLVGNADYLAYSPNGKLLAVPSGSEVFLFDAASGQYLRTLAGHTDQVYRVTFSPDGERLASASFDHTIRLWTPADGRPLRTLTGHAASVHGLAFAPDGCSLGSSDFAGVVMVWDLSTGEGRAMSGKHDGRVISVAFSPDGKTLASAGQTDATIRLWNPATGDLNSRLPLAGGDLHREVAFSPDGKLLACGSGATLTVWDANTLHEKFTVPASAAGCTVFTADSRTLVTATHELGGGAAPVVKRWDAATGKELGVFPIRVHGPWGHAALAPDGTTVAAVGDDDRVVGVYDLATGKPRFPQTGHTDGAAALAFSRDGKLLATGARDGAVKLWDLAEGKELRTLLGHGAEVRTASFSPDGKTLVTGAWSANGGRLWDVATGRRLYTLSIGGWWFDAVAFHPDGHTVAGGGADQCITLWDAATGAKMQTIPAHGANVHALAYSEDGRLLASASWDCFVKVWDADTGELKRGFRSGEARLLSVAFFPDGATVAAAGEDGVVRLWRLSTGDLRQAMPGAAGPVSSLAVSPDGRMIAASGQDGVVRLWDMTASPPREKNWLLFPLGCWINTAAFSPDGRHLATANPDGTVYIFRLATPENPSRPWPAAAPTTLTEVRRFRGHVGDVTKVVLARDGDRAFSAGLERDVILWDARTGEEIRRYRGHTDNVFALGLSPDGALLLSGAQDKTVRLWDVAGGQEMRQFHTDGVVSGVCFSADGVLAAASCWDRHVRFWSIASAQLVRDFVYPESISGIALAPGGKRMILKTPSGALLLCDVDTGKEVRRFQGQLGNYSDVAFSADGRRLIAGGPDRTVRLWDVADGREIQAFWGHGGTVTHVALSPDGRWVVSSSEDRTWRLWDATTGREVDRRAAGIHGSSLDFSADGKFLLSADDSGRGFCLWRLPDPLAGNK